MTAITDLLARAGRTVLRLLLLAASLVFALSFLLAALFVVLGLSLWSLLTGRKPAPVVLFNRLRERAQHHTPSGWPGSATRPLGDVVDVEATEVQEPPGEHRR